MNTLTLSFQHTSVPSHCSNMLRPLPFGAFLNDTGSTLLSQVSQCEPDSLAGVSTFSFEHGSLELMSEANCQLLKVIPQNLISDDAVVFVDLGRKKSEIREQK